MLKAELRNINISILCVSICLFLFSSCVKELDTSIEIFNPRITVLSNFSPNNIWKVEVSQTTSIFDTSSNLTINDARVEIKDLDLGISFFLTQGEDGSYYAGQRKPQVGHKYEVYVDAIGFESVYAQAYVPSEVNYILTKDNRTLEDGKKVNFYNVEILDNLAEENYYVLQFEQILQELNTPDPDPIEPDDIIVSSPDILAFIDNNTRDSGDIFIDESDFDGDKFSVNVDSGQFNLPANSGGNGSNGEVNFSYIMKIKAVSQDLFLYLKTLEAYKESGDINTRLEIHSNIENGTGIFGAYNEQEIELEI